MNDRIKINKILRLIAVIAVMLLSVFAVAACNKEDGASVTLELDTSEVKTEFIVGDSFTSDGLKVIAVIDGERFVATYAEYTVSSPDMSKAGEKKVTVTFMGASASYTITVTGPSPQGLTFGLNGVKTVYTVGDKFDETNLTVSVLLNNGVVHKITEYSVSDTTFTVVGNAAVNVTATYDGQEVSGNVNACVLPKSESDYEKKEVLAFTNTGEGNERLTLYITDIDGGGSNAVAAHTYGWTVLAGSDGASVMDEFEYTYNPSGWASTFVKCVGSVGIADGGALQVSAGGAVFSAVDNLWHYVVIGWDELNFITIDYSGAKTEYFVGEAFSYAGIVVVLNRMSGATERVEATAANATFSGYDGSSAGEKTITVTYDGKTATYTVTVFEVALSSIELDDTGVKKQYLVGDEFTASGLIVTAVMNNGTRRNVDLSSCTFSGYDLSVAGEYSVSVSYEGKSATYDITVSEPVGILTEITLDYSGAVTEFVAGDAFSAAGLIVTAHYEDGSSATVDIDACAFSGYDMNTAGTQTVTVTYGGKTATYQITVGAARLERIEVDYSSAERREYVVGMQFTANGIVVTAHYSNGTTRLLNSDEYEVSSPDMSTVGVKTVTVSFEQKTAQYMIYAIPDVNWDTSKLDFSNQSGTGDTLELYVTELIGGGEGGGPATTSGWYLLKRTDGTYEMYEFHFTYIPQNDPQCTFMTEGLDAEYLDNNQGGDMFVVIGNLTFRAAANVWHNRIIGWPIWW